jgi:hypothetical protein
MDYSVPIGGNMNIGETVLAPANMGQWVEVEVIEIHGDIVRVMAPKEKAIVQAECRLPLGIGFPINRLRDTKKAKNT